jgi:hypothetical protein
MQDECALTKDAYDDSDEELEIEGGFTAPIGAGKASGSKSIISSVSGKTSASSFSIRGLLGSVLKQKVGFSTTTLKLTEEDRDLLFSRRPPGLGDDEEDEEFRERVSREREIREGRARLLRAAESDERDENQGDDDFELASSDDLE